MIATELLNFFTKIVTGSCVFCRLLGFFCRFEEKNLRTNIATPNCVLCEL